MVVPQLPPDVWSRIARFSTPETLSSLSQVNLVFNKLATHHSHYIRHAPSASPHTPIQAFRRKRALFHSPTLTHHHLLDFQLLYSAIDTALLLHVSKRLLYAFPEGHVFQLRKIIPNIKTGDPFYRLVSRIIPMYDEYVGFITGANSSLTILDLRTGHIHLSPLMSRLPGAALITGSGQVAIAGEHGQLIAQRVEDNLLAFFDWKNGLAKSVPNRIDRETIFMFGEDLRANKAPIVGTATAAGSRYPHLKKIIIRGFSHHHVILIIPNAVFVKYILRSEDKQTYVLIVTRSAHVSRATHFIAMRCSRCPRRPDRSWAWFGELPPGMVYAELRENGRMIVPSRRRVVHRFQNVTRWPVCIILKETHETPGAFETVFVKRTNQCPPPIWWRVTLHDLFVLIVGRAQNKIELVQLRRENGGFKESVVASFVIKGVIDVKVIADHYILATDRFRKMHLAHFDTFCKGAGGVYACPLSGRLSSRLFPDAFRSGVETSQKSKRRRTDDGRDRRNDVAWE